jgi:hypothetical protein
MFKKEFMRLCWKMGGYNLLYKGYNQGYNQISKVITFLVITFWFYFGRMLKSFKYSISSLRFS